MVNSLANINNLSTTIKTIVAVILLSGIFVFTLGSVAFAGDPIDKQAKPLSNCTGQDCIDQNPIVEDIRVIIRVLAAGVGIAITISIIVGGIRYLTAGSDAGAVNSAKKMITNAIFALVIFIFSSALLEWLTPGDLF